MTIFCITLLVIPGFATTMALRRKRRNRVSAALLIVAGASLTTGLFLGYFTEFVSDAETPWILALIPVPLVVFLVSLAVQAACQKWRSILLWLLFAGAVSITLSIVVLWLHATRADLALQTGEQYSMTGWYLIGLWGSYITGLFMALAVMTKWVLHRF